MDDQPHFSHGIPPLPAPQDQGRPGPSTRRRVLVVLGTVTGVLVAGAVVVAGGLALLRGLNPMGDEWVCSDGEAPAGTHGFYNRCFVEGEALPAGVEWDPFGNRPMPYNCDKDGWMQIERTVTRRGVSELEQDCVREGTELPDAWHPVTED